MKSSFRPTVCRRIPLRSLARLFLLIFLLVPAAHAEQTWKMNIKNADIQEFVRQVAQITGKTFIIDPRLKGDVTVLSNTSMDADAVYALFLSVLRVHNFTATASGDDVVRIQQNALGKQTPGVQGELAEVPPEELVTRVISAQNVASAELLKILRPLIPQYGHIASVDQPNIVIISDHADNIIRLQRIIRQIDVADEEELIVRPLVHAWVGTVVATLETVAPDQLGRSAKGPQRVRLIANENNNTLIIKGNARPAAEILKLVEQLDQPTTARGSTRVIYLNHADATAVGELLTGIITEDSGGGENEGIQPTTIKADESLNAIVVKADPSKFGEIQELVAALDIRRSQVLIEAAIVEVSLDDRLNLGVELAAAEVRGETLPLISTRTSGAIGNLVSSLIPDAGGNIDVLSGLGSLTSPTLAAAKIDAEAVSFAAVLSALATNQDANLLSTPSIMTLDNQEAKITVGNEVPFRTGSFTTTTDGANNPFTTIQREDVGLQLTVTPQVNEGSTVRLEIAQEVSAVVPGVTIGTNGASDLITSKRTIETVVLADDKQTVVLGGLIQDDVSKAVNKVPLLGDIPILGHLFKSRNNSRTKRNLLVFLRPTVIRTLEDAGAATQKKYHRIYEVEIESIGRGYDSVDDLLEGRRAKRNDS